MLHETIPGELSDAIMRLGQANPQLQVALINLAMFDVEAPTAAPSSKKKK